MTRNNDASDSQPMSLIAPRSKRKPMSLIAPRSKRKIAERSTTLLFRSSLCKLKSVLAWGMVGLFAAGAFQTPLNAEESLLQLAGFDTPRIEQLYPADDDESIGELAKLVYRINRLNRSSIENSLSAELSGSLSGPAVELGQVVAVEGVVAKVQSLKVPARLVEFLEMRQLDTVTVEIGEQDDKRAIEVITSGFPPTARSGDRIRGLGVVIETRPSSEGDSKVVDAIAALPLQWFPAKPDKVGWQLLANQGVSLGELSGVASRNRQPLSSEDTELFYSMLAAADRIAELPTSQRSAPLDVKPIELLKTPESFTAQWVRMQVEVVQVTRISVTEPARIKQLGADHYYQVDAMGDLGNVKVQIDSGVDAAGDGPVFQNRYPISLVYKTLPAFLQDKLEADGKLDAVVADLTILVSADAFFFRLWSYPTAYMERFGGADQFGPLLIGADMVNREQTEADPVGVNIFGWIAAVAVGVGMLGILVWNFVIGRQDREVRRQRNAREAEELKLPE
ncbi:hypothetical protein SH528x_006130 [Novipirellula sp. SH528]|uniref:hypothetical protein n=1 Tax=Novipirellula sp. SH528 TaxID=3454466 RepID=UPI003FA0CA05